MKRKTIINQNLLGKTYWFVDDSLTSPEYFQITEFPKQLTAGKNLFKLKASTNTLRVGSMLNVEVIDFNGNPIYHEVLSYLDDDKSRIVAIYVYSDTPVGDCTITVTGEAVNVPTEWQGVQNIRWSRTVSVNSNIVNTSEVIFETEPTVTITEQVATHLDRSYTLGQTPTYSTGLVRYFSYNGQPAIEITGGKFTNDMNGGTLTVTAPQSPTPMGGLTLPTTTYTSSIKKILSDSLALLNEEYSVYSTSSFRTYSYNAFNNSTFSISYTASPTYAATQNSESFAIVEIDGLQPATGDVARVKTFMNNNGTVGTWELINDIELTDTEIFVSNTASLFPDQSIGSFTSQSVINTYWEGHTYVGKTETTAPTLSYQSASLMNALSVTSAVDISAKNAVHVVQIKSAYRSRFVADNSYKVTIDAIGTKTDSNNARLSIYMSGSAFDYESADYFTQNLATNLGRRIGYIDLPSSTRVDDYVIEFEADRNGSAVMLLVIESGTWQVSNIRTTSNNETGYTPNYTRIRSLVPTAHKSANQLSFKTEYYNIAGERSKQVSYVYDKSWTGGNRYIDGDYSMITGSLYVADTLESGIAITGQRNTGYVRSLGYTGFDAGNPGFLIWSGSALPGATSKGAAYSGVGIELYSNTASYFRYSTRDSELDVRTNKFFLGSSNQFISGANGNIEISSSGFHLDAAGNITASNGEYRGNNTADFYQFRVVTIGGSLNNLSTYTAGGQTYYALNLTGSYDPALQSTGPGMFVRIATALSYPIGSINIHPAGWATGKYVYYGAIVVIESANDDCYLSSTGYNILPDGDITYDNDDFVALGFKTQTVGGNTYYNTLQLTSGNRALLVQSAFDWKVQSLTSYDTVQVQFPAGIAISQSLTVTGSLNVSGSSIFNSTVDVYKKLQVFDSASVNNLYVADGATIWSDAARYAAAFYGDVYNTGNVSIGYTNANATLDVSGSIRAGIMGGVAMYFGQEASSGIPSSDGARIKYEDNGALGSGDALIIEKTDANGATPDGGILFANVGNNGIRRPTLSILGNGNIAIRTTSSTHALTIEASSGSTNAENIFKTQVEDADAYFEIVNGTTANGVFLPLLRATQTGSNTLAMSLQNRIYQADDTGTNAIMTFNARYITGAAISGSSTRPLFVFQNYTSSLIQVMANGNVGIGDDADPPVAKLHINNTSTSASFLVEDSTNPDITPFIIDTAGNVGIGKTAPSSSLDVSGSVFITGSLRVTGSATINGTAFITGSLAVATGSIGNGENTLLLGPAPAGGTGEGGQLALLSIGGTYTSSSFLDNYQNQFRILSGPGATSNTGVFAIDLGTRNAKFEGAVTASGFNGLPNDYLYVTRNTDQTVGSNWTNTDIIFNNSVVSKGISYNTGTGLASLTGGKVYRITARLAWSAAAAYLLEFSCYNSSNTQIGPTTQIVQSTNGSNNISDGTLDFIYAPSSNVDIKIRTTANTTALSGEKIRGDLNTQLIIQQIA